MPPLRVFISYASADESLRQELDKHLSLLKRDGVVETWTFRDIDAGADWRSTIDSELERAEMILLLVSENFIASDYCWNVEMRRALQRHRDERALLIPIILRKCDWSAAPFAGIQALPPGARPVTASRPRDKAWTLVAEALRRVATATSGATDAEEAPATTVPESGVQRAQRLAAHSRHEMVRWSIGIAALLGGAAFAASRQWNGVRQSPDRTPQEIARFQLREDAWTPNDLDVVWQLGMAAVGPQFPPPEWLRPRLEQNPDILRVVRPTDRDEINGYVLLYPLTASATRRIQNGVIQSGNDLAPTDMCKSFSRARSLYIGMVFGYGQDDRAFVLGILERKLLSLREKAHPITVFGKPGSADGARLLRKFCFHPIRGNENVCAIEYEALYARLKR